MRKYLLPSALILAFGIALAGAQVITKSLQVTQDPRSPVGLDASNNVYFPAHVLTSQSAPALTSCGSGSPTVTGSDFGGQITEGSSATGCILTFKEAFAAAPGCVISSSNAASGLGVTTSTIAMTIVHSSYSSITIGYLCTGAK